MKLDPNLVKNSLSAHSWLGLLVGALMYAICLSGALLVFHAELEQWEQPDVEEFSSIDVAGMEQMFNNYLRSAAEVTPHMYLVLPTKDSPRARLATENQSWFLNADGSVAQAEDNHWSEMLLDLHLYLHLPKTWGMLFVSALGAVLVGLIISGFFSHPKIFRDAFNLRLGGSKQLEQTDIHNRLSVWGAPFYLVIAITGAYFGLALPILNLYAQAEHEGNTDKVVSMVFGEEPTLNAPPGPVQVAKALEKLAEIAPKSEPLMIVLHDAGEPKQHLSISAFHPGRLTYAEVYLFDTNGNYLRSDGYLDGATGKQAVYSIYRLHFGTFAGAITKWVYLILGLGLAVVSATGINVWLARRRIQDPLNHLWVGLVWGLPFAIVGSAALKIGLDAPPVPAFWGLVVLACGLCLTLYDVPKSRSLLRSALVVTAFATVAIQISLHGNWALTGHAGYTNFALAGCALAGGLFQLLYPGISTRSLSNQVA